MIQEVLRALDRSPLLVLTGLVLIATGARFALATQSPAPCIFTDELVYWELGRSLAEEGRLAVRGESVYFSAIVPLLHAPGHLLGGAAVAYDWVKLANAAIMAAAAYPAYGLARMALSRRLSLAFATLVLAWPAFAYTGTVMTEPAFFTAVLAFAWALARALERPTAARQAVVLGLVIVAALVRLQGAVLLVSAVLACALAALLIRGAAGGALGRLRVLWPLLAFGVGAPALLAGAQVVRDRSLRDLLGGYEGVELGAGFGPLAEWTVWHVAVTALAVGVVPLAIAAAAWGRLLTGRWREPGGAAVLIACFAIALPMLLQVAAFAADNALRVQERNLFAIEPLIVLVALIGLLAGGLSRVVALTGAGLLALAVAHLPVASLIAPVPPLSDTFTLLSVMETAERSGITAPSVVRIVAFLAVLLTGAVLAARRRIAAAGMAGGLLALLVGMNAQITPLLSDFSERVGRATVPAPRDWIDRASEGEPVAFLQPSADDPKLAWQAEFWNASVGTVLGVPSPVPPGIAQTNAALDPVTGRLEPPPGAPPPPESLLVAPAGWSPVGTPVAEAAAGAGRLTLWRVAPPLRLRETTAGLFADGWTGPLVEVRRFGCASGAFLVRMSAGVGARQRVRVGAGAGERVVLLRRGRRSEVRVPARPDPSTDVCVLRVEPLRTATGAQLGNPADPRELGVRALPPRFIGGS